MGGPNRDVAVVSVAQTPMRRAAAGLSETEMIEPAIRAALDGVGAGIGDIDFVCSGSSDYLAGQAFSFVMTLDAVGAWPPISESHVEMDGAWALYEAWVKIQAGHADTALVFSYSKASPGDLPRVLSRQLDPYYYGPLWPDAVALAGMQARALLDAGIVNEADLAAVAERNRNAAAANNPNAQLRGSAGVDDLLAAPYVAEPLRRHDCPPITDGGVAVVLAAGDAARRWSDRPAWIRGIDHRIDSHNLGARDLTRAPSIAVAAERAGATGAFDVAELHAPFTHQEHIVRSELGLGDDVDVNPSGGALAANPVMAAGLLRIAEVATRISAGTAGRGVAHATGGQLLQQNLVCVLEGDS
jgi:acetyl-CoA acetyltransferase